MKKGLILLYVLLSSASFVNAQPGVSEARSTQRAQDDLAMFHKYGLLFQMYFVMDSALSGAWVDNKVYQSVLRYHPGKF